MGGLLEGKTILVTGIITDASIAFHVAKVDAGAGRQGSCHGIRSVAPDRPHRSAVCRSRCRRPSLSMSRTPTISPDFR